MRAPADHVPGLSRSTRRLLGTIGRTAIGAGVLLLLFVAYELWGTNVTEAHNQRVLAHQYHVQRARPVAAAPPVVLPGYAVGVISIPKVHLEKYLVEGVDQSELREGPGHYPGTALPGQPGNVAVAGHRTTYGAPFYDIDQLAAGDPILLQTGDGRSFEYDVTGSEVVRPTDVGVVGPTPGYRLTLTTCTPRYSAADRLIVFAVLKGTPRPTQTRNDSPGTGADRSGPAVIADDSAPVGPDVIGTPRNLTTGSSGAIPSVVGWAMAATGLWAGLRLASHRRRSPWAVYLLAGPALMIPLYFLFENVSRLLPSSV